MRQGDVFWADAGAPSGVRPVVILTRSIIIPRLNAVTIAPITSTIRGIPTEATIQLKSITNRASAVSLDNITTLEKSAFLEFIESLDERTMVQIFTAIHAAFEMPF